MHVSGRLAACRGGPSLALTAQERTAENKIGQAPPGQIRAVADSTQRRLFCACERLRSKPMRTLTHPENGPCGYAVDMLRTTRARA